MQELLLDGVNTTQTAADADTTAQPMPVDAGNVTATNGFITNALIAENGWLPISVLHAED